MSETFDPTCPIHGLKKSDHECLYCCLCFKPLTKEQCAFLPDGKKEDSCIDCAIAERKRLPAEFHKLHTTIATLTKSLEEARNKGRELLKAINDLAAQSEGVIGLHKNGEVAFWDELLPGGRNEEWLGESMVSLDAFLSTLGGAK